MNFEALAAAFDRDEIEDEAEIVRRERRRSVRERARIYADDLASAMEALGMIDADVAVEAHEHPQLDSVEPEPAALPATEPELVEEVANEQEQDQVDAAEADQNESSEPTIAAQPRPAARVDRARPSRPRSPEERARQREVGLARMIALSRVPNRPIAVGSRSGPDPEQVGLALALVD